VKRSQKSLAPVSKAIPPRKAPAEQAVRDIRRATRKLHSAAGKIRIVLQGLRGDPALQRLSKRRTP